MQNCWATRRMPASPSHAGLGATARCFQENRQDPPIKDSPSGKSLSSRAQASTPVGSPDVVLPMTGSVLLKGIYASCTRWSPCSQEGSHNTFQQGGPLLEYQTCHAFHGAGTLALSELRVECKTGRLPHDLQTEETRICHRSNFATSL